MTGGAVDGRRDCGDGPGAGGGGAGDDGSEGWDGVVTGFSGLQNISHFELRSNDTSDQNFYLRWNSNLSLIMNIASDRKVLASHFKLCTH